ncbi:MAG: 3-methyl-2-oxobutanoate hydroxymethyltransferase [Firmicutes bacterium]|nr:3-methyl-2-oxobutanoate hydroxymethyltransferase [Bacillota bacterium]
MQAKNTVLTFRQAKQENKKLTMLTAYDYSTAKLIDESGINSILVGDSLGNVMLGYSSTISVTMDDMIHHGKAVTRAVKNALVVVDMPFMSYQTSVYDSVVNAGRLIKETNANAVKLESAFFEEIAAITKASIPVVAHLGLTPQSVNSLGGYKVQGITEESAKKIASDAQAVQDAGAFAVVLECVPAKLAKYITQQLKIPTIGIGAGRYCDGQVLVYHDMLGMVSDFKPKFVKQYANLGETMKSAFSNFSEEVQNGTFPTKENEYNISDEIIEKLY